MAQKTEVHSAAGIRLAKVSRSVRASAGPEARSSTAWLAERSWPMTAAAGSPRPTQSPTRTPIRWPGTGTTSYQSPPTSSGATAGAYRTANPCGSWVGPRMACCSVRATARACA